MLFLGFIFVQGKAPAVDLNPAFLDLSNHAGKAIVHSIHEEQTILIAHISILLLKRGVDCPNFPL